MTITTPHSSALALVNGRVLTDDGLVEGRCVLIEQGRIVDVVDSADPRCAQAVQHDLGGNMLLPGFIDSQVNGGGGVLFNDAPSVAAIREIGRAHRKFGTTGFLPTLISADLDDVATAIEAVQNALTLGVPGVLGIHIEGPFLNVERKGIHDPDKIRELDPAAVSLLTSLRGGRTLVTLAPPARILASGLLVDAHKMRTATLHAARGLLLDLLAISPALSHARLARRLGAHLGAGINRRVGGGFRAGLDR